MKYRVQFFRMQRATDGLTLDIARSENAAGEARCWCVECRDRGDESADIKKMGGRFQVFEHMQAHHPAREFS